MAQVVPFRGVHYRPKQVGDIGGVIAPPYDVISLLQQEALYRRSPYNIVRLEYGRSQSDDTDANDRYSRAAAEFSSWLEAGALAVDDAPCFYLYRQEFQHADKSYTRRSLFARVRLEDWAAGIIKPHEYTLASPKADRLHLLHALRAQVSPVYGLYKDESGEVGDILARGESVGTPIEAEDDMGQRHRLRALTGASVEHALADFFSRRPLYIADGHHRYETGLAYRDERRDAAKRWSGDEPENFIMMGLTAVDDPGLVILPIHRLVRPQPPSGTLMRLAEGFRVRRLDSLEPGDLSLALRPLAGKAVGFVMYAPSLGGAYVLELVQPDAVHAVMPAESPMPWRELDVNVLQYGVLAPVLGIGPDEIAQGGILEFTEDFEGAVRDVREGRYGAAFLMNPTLAGQILAVAEEGWRMPQKSTFFFPKLGTGLVLNWFEV